jgi:hypothetical protein
MYLAFDLDATLGDFASVWKILSTLRQSRYYFDSNPALIKPYPNEDFRVKIDVAYNNFVKAISVRERSKDPLGLFRPGIFEVFEKVVFMKRSGFVKGVIIYSNNSSLATLEFVRDIFHHSFNYKIFDDLIHMQHRLRIRSNSKVDIRKNWVELHKILVSGECKAPLSIGVNQVKFFDDQIHIDLLEKMGTNYVRVSPYCNRVNMAYMTAILRKVLNESELLKDEHFLNYVDSDNLESYLVSIERAEFPSPSRPICKNTSIKQMMHSLKIPNSISNNNYKLSKIYGKTRRGGKRKYRSISMRRY